MVVLEVDIADDEVVVVAGSLEDEVDGLELV